MFTLFKKKGSEGIYKDTLIAENIRKGRTERLYRNTKWGTPRYRFEAVSSTKEDKETDGWVIRVNDTDGQIAGVLQGFPDGRDD